ncbi:hypothetical protein [Polyangium sorediatum]|uniref:LptF/LptG family permease n=1 Tax=Polyangium sorediatum TaxID=889274 RepID=A0ABT6NIE2_9BACT|nr:hypothetical protein [Polyangium sorediatum]MDI1428068.1 hypothetical protein [Polyangium sorediatum]
MSRSIVPIPPGLRLLALPTCRDVALVAALVTSVSVAAGLVRSMPLLLAPSVPARLGLPFARAALAISLEVALVLAPPLGAALAAARLVDRGEARAVFALGASPRSLVASALPVWLLVFVLSALASLAWGLEAEAPGRLASRLLADGRAACVDRAARDPQVPHAATVPMAEATWICLPGEPPRLVMSPSLLGGSALAARSIELSADTASLVADDLVLALPSNETTGPMTVRVARASVRGLLPLGRPSNLRAPVRAALLGATSAASALLTSLAVLVSSIRGRALALFVGLSGPALALLVLSALEREKSSLLAYGLVPALGLLGPLLAARFARILASRRAPGA